jgi:hypothetical protein
MKNKREDFVTNLMANKRYAEECFGVVRVIFVKEDTVDGETKLYRESEEGWRLGEHDGWFLGMSRNKDLRSELEYRRGRRGARSSTSPINIC